MKYILKFETYNYDNLIFYVKTNNIKHIKELIENGVNLNEQDIAGNTALHWAACNSFVEIIKLLVDAGIAGIDVNIRNNNGKTALIFAASFAHINAVNSLIDGDADWNIKDKFGKDFLYYLHISNREFIINLYPEKYKEYLIKKDMEKYNL